MFTEIVRWPTPVVVIRTVEFEEKLDFFKYITVQKVEVPAVNCMLALPQGPICDLLQNRFFEPVIMRRFFVLHEAKRFTELLGAIHYRQLAQVKLCDCVVFVPNLGLTKKQEIWDMNYNVHYFEQWKKLLYAYGKQDGGSDIVWPFLGSGWTSCGKLFHFRKAWLDLKP